MNAPLPAAAVDAGVRLMANVRVGLKVATPRPAPHWTALPASRAP